EESRHRALEWLLAVAAERVMIVGHSHGGDHASLLAAEYHQRSQRAVDILITVDPMNSPLPFALRQIKDRAAVIRHVNYYQRNAPWFGGSIPEADCNQDVSEPQLWPSWSRILAGAAEDVPAITHTTIDEDLFLHGEFARWRRCRLEGEA
ncbi:MAG: hypothetical protein N3A66_08690, partial [Planctomycetota bacterium]|nr:hypothetical protein [Planctomycetota bacterium]